MAAFDIAGPDALYPGNPFGLPAVIETDDMPAIGSGSGKHPLKLNAGDNIFVTRKAEFSLASGVVLLEAGGQDDGADIQFHDFVSHGVIHSLLIAGRNTGHAFGALGAVQATLGFRRGILNGESGFHFLEIGNSIGNGEFLRRSARALFNRSGGGEKFFRDRMDRCLEAIGRHVFSVQITVDGFRGPFSRRYCLNDRRRSRGVVASGKNAWRRGLQCFGIDFEATPFRVQAEMPDQPAVDPLADGDENPVGVDGGDVLFIIPGGKPAVLVKDLGAGLQLDSGDGAFAENAVGTPTVADRDAFRQGGLDLFAMGWHFVPFFQGNHLDLGRAQPERRSGYVNRNIAAADDQDVFPCDFSFCFFLCSPAQKLKSVYDPGFVFPGNAQRSAD
ncbi:MAG: hypothetical protein A4E66_02236 [Syntrophus sp. PtaB.Bin001]|nr:MAG: hypothetical protein A4E66_02236 [Syntrophus sp. PtaB.Bin001]